MKDEGNLCGAEGLLHSQVENSLICSGVNTLLSINLEQVSNKRFVYTSKQILASMQIPEIMHRFMEIVFETDSSGPRSLSETTVLFADAETFFNRINVFLNLKFLEWVKLIETSPEDNRSVWMQIQEDIDDYVAKINGVILANKYSKQIVYTKYSWDFLVMHEDGALTQKASN
jgi:hypothetical protein